MLCPHCSKPNPGGLVHCRECGKPLLIARDNPAGIEWVEIPAGEFLCSNDIYGGNIPVFERSFKIGKYPVTNAQYLLYLQANPAVAVPRDWDSEKRIHPSGRENHPVVQVSYVEATAFCKWGGYSLPDNMRWEKAARGTDGRTYPWGEDWQDGRYCNSQEANIGETTPVDNYPLGASPYGVMDMSGNVWEWNRSRGLNNRTAVIVRGGSCSSIKEAVSCSYKDEELPNNRHATNGFRCVDFLHL